jgi:hypothetical protein
LLVQAEAESTRIASALVSTVQYDLMALLDQEPGRHEAEPVRRSRYEYASHRRTSSYRDHPADDPEWFSCASRASLRSVLGILTDDI